MASVIAVPLAANAANPVDPNLPTPVIHLGDVCLTPDGTGVEPFEISFSWGEVPGNNFDVTYSINEVNADGSTGAEASFGRGQATGTGLSIWPSDFGSPADVVFRGLHAGSFVVSVHLTDYSRASGSDNGAVGGTTGTFDSETATKQFEVGACGVAAPQISLSAATVTVGEPLTISVTGAQAGEALSFTLHSDVVQLGTATADENGNAALTATIPANVPAGTHTVMVDGEATHLEKTVTVTEASTPMDPANPKPVDQGGHKIPTTVQTDGNQAPVLWLTASLLLMALATAGGAGLVWRRARR